MDTTEETIEQLREQEQALGRQIDQLTIMASASSTSGIREFRNTRLRQLEAQRLELSERLRRLPSGPSPVVEAHMLGAALREAQLVADSTFRL